MQGVFYAFLGTLFTFGITALGACNVFAVRKKTGHTMEALTLGFAGGVMVAASIWSLLIPGMERAKELGQTSYLVMSAGFLAGVGLLLAADRWIQKKSDGKKSKSTQMLVIAITAHNIPEGMAVGVVLAGWMAGNGAITAAATLALSIGIAIQNFPEGAVIAIPLHGEGVGKSRAFLYGVLSGAAEPLAAVLAIWAAGLILPALPYLLSFAAGAMVYVVVEELIPESSAGRHSNLGTLFFAVGFTIMLALDVALG